MRPGDAVLIGALALPVLAALASEGGLPPRSLLDRLLAVAAASDGAADSPSDPGLQFCKPCAKGRVAGPANASSLPHTPTPSTGPTPTSPSGPSDPTDLLGALDYEIRTRAPPGAPTTRKSAAKAALADDEGALIPGGLGSCVAGTAAVYEPSGRFLYATQSAGKASRICGYRIEPATNTLTSIPGSPFAVPPGSSAEGVTADPSGRFVFVADGDSDSVSVYTIGAATGALVPVPGSPYPAGRFPRWVAVDPSGRFLYAANNGITAAGSISAYAVDRATGALTPLPGAPYPAGHPMSVAIDPTGRFLYVGGDDLQAYAIDGATGALAKIGAPIPGYRAGVAVDPSGRFVYTSGFDAVEAFAIDANGALVPVGTKVPAGSNSLGLAVSRSGRYLYVANLTSNSISGYRIDLATGALSPIPGSPFAALDRPFSIATGGGMPGSAFADAGYPYSDHLAAFGGTPPYAWSIERGTLPPGLALAGSTGMVSGVPTTTGTYDFTVRLADAAGAVAYRDYVLTVSPNGQAPGSGNYQGLWWRSPAGSEAGWGINFTHQGDIVFATWFTYGADGKPLWLAAVLNRTAPGVYAGDVFTTTGPPLDAQPWDPASVVETTVGTMSVTFADDDSATLAYAVNGVQQVKPITRQVFASPVAVCTWGGAPDLALATNFQDLWWRFPAGTESGWGVNFTQQGNLIFVTWFTYDASGKPLWLIAVAERKSAGVYEGPISSVTGPPFSAQPWDPAAVVETVVGATTITFLDGNRATFAYTVAGVPGTKEITRQVFAPPGTICQ